MKCKTVLQLVCLLLPLSISLHRALAKTTQETLPFFGDFQVKRYSLENGLKLLVVEDHSSPTFAYQTWFQVGSRNEIRTRTGLAHLFEHMMFKETKNLKDGEFDRLLEGAGAEGENAFTSRDYTAYVQELPKDQLDMIAQAEADRMVNLVISEKSYSTEREVVQNERRFRNENSPDGLMDQELFGLAFKNHPYHWPVIGYQQDLDKMSVKDALEFYRAYYSPNHATVVVVGDVKGDEVLKTVEKYYGKLVPQNTPAHLIPSEPPQKSAHAKNLKLNIQVEKLMMGYRTPEITHSDIPALNILESLLAGGKSSRLHRALVETGIATGVGTDQNESKDPTLFVIAANLQEGKKAKQAESIILKELSKLTQEVIPAQELERAKNKSTFGFYEGLDSNYEKAQFLGYFQTVAGDFVLGVLQHDKMQQITASEIQTVARRYFQPQNRTTITGLIKNRRTIKTEAFSKNRGVKQS